MLASVRQWRVLCGSGSAAAVKFRDPEGHPLELLQLPSPGAKRKLGAGLLSIDHSGISVSDIAGSCRFYEALGLSVREQTLNRGPTQIALDRLPNVEGDVVPMLPHGATPHLELLGYRHPSDRSAGQMEASDIAATRIVWAADRDQLLRDPDGHLHLLRRGWALLDPVVARRGCTGLAREGRCFEC